MNRKKFIYRGLALLGLFVTGKIMLAKRKTPTIASYTSNPALATVKPDWKGTPLDEDGLFINHEYPWKLEYGNVSYFPRISQIYAEWISENLRDLRETQTLSEPRNPLAA